MTRQVPEPGQGIIMWKVIEKRMKEKMDGSMFIGTWWSLVPPLLAIVLAFLTKEVYSSLFVGVAVGALLYTGFSPWDSFVSFFEIMKDSMNLNILIFDVLLGMIRPAPKQMRWKWNTPHFVKFVRQCRFRS